MRTIARLFSRSPFSPLQTHLKKVIQCFDTLSTVFNKLSGLDAKHLEKASTEIAKLENEAESLALLRSYLPSAMDWELEVFIQS
jgi:uncharacterized protein Yka (UPF0111/DUF47 family)